MPQTTINKQTTSLIIASVLALAPSVALSNEAELTGTGELGFSDSTGNTVSTSLYTALKLAYNKENYTIKSALELSYKSENGTQTEERYAFDSQVNRYYSADKSYYSFVGVKLEKSVFEDIELDSTLSVGLGKTLYNTEATNLNGQLGAGYQNTDYITAGSTSQSQVAYIAKLDLSHKINQQVNFTQDLSYATGTEQTKIESNTGFTIKVAEKMNLKAAYKYRNNSNPAAGAKKTDTQTLLTLTYDF